MLNQLHYRALFFKISKNNFLSIVESTTLVIDFFGGNTGVEPCPSRFQRDALTPRALLPMFDFLMLWCSSVQVLEYLGKTF